MALTDKEVRGGKPNGKARKIADGKGLHLFITPAGGKVWRFRYYMDGREKLIAFGAYPEVSLAKAREERNEARRQVAAGKDPSAERRAEKARAVKEANDSFEAATRDFVAKRAKLWTPTYADYFIRRFEVNIFPALGKRPVAQIEAPELLSVLRKVEARGAHEMAERLRGMLGQGFRYGIANGMCMRNPAADLCGALAPYRSKKLPAVPLEEAPDLFRKLEAAEEAQYRTDRITALGLRLLPLVMLRPGELRHGLWSQIDWDAGQWVLPIGAMKDKERDHEVPLSRQAIMVLRELHKLTGGNQLLFPGEGKKGVMSENTLNNALHRLGLQRAPLQPRLPRLGFDDTE